MESNENLITIALSLFHYTVKPV